MRPPGFGRRFRVRTRSKRTWTAKRTPRRGGPFTAFLENHRILVSRLFAAAFFGVLLSMESRLEGTLAEPVLS